MNLDRIMDVARARLEAAQMAKRDRLRLRLCIEGLDKEAIAAALEYVRAFDDGAATEVLAQLRASLLPDTPARVKYWFH